MPVVSITSSRLKEFIPGVKEEKILDMLPFAGLDIEGTDNGIVRVEYNPNRPDFSSDYGIFRAIRGLLGIELGLPKLKIAKSGFSVIVESKVRAVRPYIFALVARGGSIDDQTIKQLIAMQEDLHEGIGRHRRKASVGLHDLEPIQFPVTYTAVGPDYSFTPLEEPSPKSIERILEETEMGRQYGHILSGSKEYPAITDKAGNALSFPPIINAEMTRVSAKTHDLFVEVTATDRKVGQDVLAIVAMTMHDAGFAIKSVTIRGGRSSRLTPDMRRSRVVVDTRYINSILGLDLDARKLVKSLQKARLDARVRGHTLVCEIPRYRTDISDPIDIAEEVAIGYGVLNIEPAFPASPTAGGASEVSRHFESTREVLVGQGMLETIGFSLSSAKILYEPFGRTAQGALQVDGPKSAEHEYLRDSLIPSLLYSLSRNVHEEYPQKLFELGKVFHKGPRHIIERSVVSACVAHVDANYSEIKAAVQVLLATVFGKTTQTRLATSPFFIQGRTGEILVDGRLIGSVGEVTPMALDNLRMRVPVSAFEVDLTDLLRLEQ